jgi:phosphate transport system substrate-binding protein
MKMKMKMKSLYLSVALVAISGSAALGADEIRIVGSSTVYPFTTVVAERFGRTTDFSTPIVESTGTGGGFKLFCESAANNTPSVSNASRAIEKSEVALCAKNGVQNIIEVKIGYDGIVIANAKAAQTFKLTTKDIFLALADEVPVGNGQLQKNPSKTWSDVNSSLPNVKIEVLGPPPTSGTRDAFLELAMEAGCKQFKWIKDLNKSDNKVYKNICHSLREDGAYVDAGENDNLIVQRLQANPGALGIFGYSFLDQNTDVVKAAQINNIDVSFESISDGTYPIARPLFFYVKGEHFGKVPGLQGFMAEFISDNASGEQGYLSERGLIPMSEAERNELLSLLSTKTPKMD